MSKQPKPTSKPPKPSALRKTLRPLLASCVLLAASCGAPGTPNQPQTEPRCQAPSPPPFPEPPESLCPETSNLVCWDPGYVVDLAVWRRSVERTLHRLETCQWIDWYAP